MFFFLPRRKWKGRRPFPCTRCWPPPSASPAAAIAIPLAHAAAAQGPRGAAGGDVALYHAPTTPPRGSSTGSRAASWSWRASCTRWPSGVAWPSRPRATPPVSRAWGSRARRPASVVTTRDACTSELTWACTLSRRRDSPACGFATRPHRRDSSVGSPVQPPPHVAVVPVNLADARAPQRAVRLARRLAHKVHVQKVAVHHADPGGPPLARRLAPRRCRRRRGSRSRTRGARFVPHAAAVLGIVVDPLEADGGVPKRRLPHARAEWSSSLAGRGRRFFFFARASRARGTRVDTHTHARTAPAIVAGSAPWSPRPRAARPPRAPARRSSGRRSTPRAPPRVCGPRASRSRVGGPPQAPPGRHPPRARRTPRRARAQTRAHARGPRRRQRADARLPHRARPRAAAGAPPPPWIAPTRPRASSCASGTAAAAHRRNPRAPRRGAARPRPRPRDGARPVRAATRRVPAAARGVARGRAARGVAGGRAARERGRCAAAPTARESCGGGGPRGRDVVNRALSVPRRL